MKFLHLTNWEIYHWQGKYFTDDLWRRDLVLHFDYLKRITLLSPVLNEAPPKRATEIDPNILTKIELVSVPRINRKPEFVAGIIPYLIKLFRELQKADTMQCIMVEQPILYGILLPILSKFTRIKTIVFVESSKWRKAYLRGIFSLSWKFREYMCKRAVKHAHVAFFTQDEYKNSLHGNPQSSLVIPAVWLGEKDCITKETLEEALQLRSQDDRLSLGYFGGITFDKGLDILIRAVGELIESGKPVELDIYGKGDMLEKCQVLANSHSDRIRFCGLLPYGPIFHSRVRKCDVVVIPSRTNEHLRITVDAMSQGVPVIASDVPGLRQFVKHNHNGMLVRPLSTQELSQAVTQLQNKDLRRNFAYAALETVTGMTHKSMHLARARHLQRCLPGIEQFIGPESL